MEETLELVGVEERWRRRPMETYRTGVRRRVELARALLGQPRVLFLDGPTRGLDLPAKRGLGDVLRALVRTDGVTIFVSSHEVSEIQALCEQLAVLHRGRLAWEGRAAALGADAATFETRLISILEGRAALPETRARS